MESILFRNRFIMVFFIFINICNGLKNRYRLTARSYIIYASKSYILFKIARSCLNKHVETQFEKMDVCFGFLIDTQKTVINVYIVPLFGLAGNMQSYLYVSIYSYYQVLFLNIYPVIRNKILANLIICWALTSIDIRRLKYTFIQL